MTLAKTSTSTALAVIPRDKKTAKPSPAKEAAPSSGDSVDIRGTATPPAYKTFDGNAIPADDDGPGAGGGYKPQQDPAEGPGAGGGYDGDEIPSDDDGPGAGGGYEVEQEPAESDGPGAGGGYFTEEGSLFGARSQWNRPLTVFSDAPLMHDIDVSTQYTPHWIQVLPADTFSWTINTGLEPVVDSQGSVVKKDAKQTPKKDEKKA